MSCNSELSVELLMSPIHRVMLSCVAAVVDINNGIAYAFGIELGLILLRYLRRSLGPFSTPSGSQILRI